MPLALDVERELKEVFTERQATVLSRVIVSCYDELVKARDFNELKEIVQDIAKEQRELVKAQKRTEEAQRRTEIKVEELAEAQKKTEIKVAELAEAQKKTEVELQKLSRVLDSTKSELGGLSRSVAYSLENEAYKALPSYLKKNMGIEITKRMVRTTIEGEEINIFGMGRKNETPVVIVGEAELKLSSVNKFKQLERKVRAIKKIYKEDIIKIIITHYATPPILEKAKERDISVIQSFEWQ